MVVRIDKSLRYAHVIMLVGWFVTYIFAFIPVIRRRGGFVMMVLLCAALFAHYLLLLETIRVNRTIILDKSGCEIICWKFRRKYSWDEMWFRRWCEFPAHERIVSDFQGCVWFSTVPVDIPKHTRVSYMEKYDPLARVCLHVYPMTAAQKQNRDKSLFVVDRDEFRQFLQENRLRVEDIDKMR